MNTGDMKDYVDTIQHPIHTKRYRDTCKKRLDLDGVLVLKNFLNSDSIDTILNEAKRQEHLAYYCANYHNVFLKPLNESLPLEHPRNKNIVSSKGCIADDQVSEDSPLRLLYESEDFQDFLCAVLGEQSLYRYDDNLSSINIHYASSGQELGWHFDNSSFAVTLLIQSPTEGGVFEYIRDFRYANNKENYDGIDSLIRGALKPNVLPVTPGSLVLFRGKEAIHRVTPVAGDRVRVMSVLAYNSKPGVSLSESARVTFYGRLG